MGNGQVMPIANEKTIGWELGPVKIEKGAMRAKSTL
jgi:hypothetical protein